MIGEIGILNVGAGDTKLSFDPSKPDEVAKASRVVTDMLRRGFAILIEVGRDDKGPLYRRAHDFDEATAEYIIAGVPEEEEASSEQEPASPPRARSRGPARSRSGKTQRVPATAAKAVAVARTAGG